MLEDQVHPPTQTVGGDPVRRRLLCKKRPEHERPELDDESEPVDTYQRVDVVDYDASGMGGKRTKLTLRPPEEYDIEDDTKEIEVDDQDMAEVLKLAQNEGLDPTGVEVGIRREMKGLPDFGVCQEICKIPSDVHTCFLLKACLGLVVVCQWSSCGACVGPPTAFLRGGTGVPWVSARPVCHRVQDDSVATRQPFFVLVGVMASCVSWSCFTLMCN